MNTTDATASSDDLETRMQEIGNAAKSAMSGLARASEAARNTALKNAAAEIRLREPEILAANALDYKLAVEQGLTAAMLDRMLLTADRVQAIAGSLDAIAGLPDPLGRILSSDERPNGLTIERVSVPLGVIGIIYESRPNVTADAGALCLKAGNAVILRGGSECVRSNHALLQCLVAGLKSVGLNEASIQLVPTQEHAAVGLLLSGLDGCVDVVVPRGGKRLIERVQRDARVPVIGHLEGLCHVYVHQNADPEMAVAIAVNAKMRRTGICGAAETLLIDENLATTLLPRLAKALTDAGCRLRGDTRACQALPGIEEAEEPDWRTEYLDAVLAIKVVQDIDEAIAHIDKYGSGHTDAIVTSDAESAERFFAEVDSAIVLHNASTQFADGGEFGMGAEIGIATGRIHARGPVGANQLTSYQYRVRGTGQVRPS